MRILILHNAYQQRGGEDAVVESEEQLLLRYSHSVKLFRVDNDSIKNLFNKLQVALSVNYSVKSRNAMRNEISRFKPDIVHVHNLFPILTPSVYDACIEKGVAVVQTLHNYRIICPGALLYRNGQICEECLNSTAYKAVLYGCYKSSHFGSLPVARTVEWHKKKGTWLNKVDRFISLTEFAKKKFVSAGIPSRKIVVKPNFVVIDKVKLPNSMTEKTYALFVGRLSEEKGINVLLESWKKVNFPLHLIGSGPMWEKIPAIGLDSVHRLGELSQQQVKREMSCARFLVVPSLWYEGFPMVIVEAFSLGLPVIVSNLGGLAEIVHNGITGLHFDPGNANDLVQKVNWMINNPDACRNMGENAKQIFQKHYTPERNYKMLIKIYKEALNLHA